MGVCWASNYVSQEMQFGSQFFQWYYWSNHWSRRFEYPWAVITSQMVKGMKVLDAGGGSSCLTQYLKQRMGPENVINVDIDPTYADLVADIENLYPHFSDDYFDRVLCISVLEHCNRPFHALGSLRNALKLGGRLCLTFDVVEGSAIDLDAAKHICKFLGEELPPQPEGILIGHLETESGEDTIVRVLCIDHVKS